MQHPDLSFYNTRGYKLTLSLVVSVFFFVFISFFLPFGVDNYDPNHEYSLEFFREIFYFFLPLLMVCSLNEFILRPVFLKQVSWSKVILWSAWSLFILTTVVFFTYNFLGNWHDFRLSSYLEFLTQVPAVLIFPMAGVFFYFQYRSLQSRYKVIESDRNALTPADDRFLHFKGAGAKDQITLSASCFIYGKAQDNYVELYYAEDNSQKKFVMRATLNKLVKAVNDESIVRCHRSFMVNLHQVKSIKGVNQDTTLYLSPFDTPVPVSKTYLQATREKLQT